MLKKPIGVFLLISISLTPYLFSLPYRLDQILIPIVVIFCLIFYKIRKRLLYLSLLLLVLCLVLPLFSTIINLNKLSFVNTYDLIRESQNILKPLIYLLFGYFLFKFFKLEEKNIHQFFKFFIVISFIFSFGSFLVQFIVGTPINFFNDFLVNYYHLLPTVSAMYRFPGLFTSPSQAGTSFVFFSFLCVVFKYPHKYLILVIITGILSNTKVFWFSLPFLFMLFILNNKNTKNIFQFLLVIILVFVLFNFLFEDILTKMFEFIFLVMQTDPLAARGENFVAFNINDLLNNYPIFGVGFTKTKLMDQSVSYGTWDSLFFYELAFGGLFGLISKTITLFLIFYIPFKKEKIIIQVSVIIFFINIYFTGIGTTSFYQERIGDMIFVFFGFYYALKSTLKFK